MFRVDNIFNKPGIVQCEEGVEPTLSGLIIRFTLLSESGSTETRVKNETPGD